MTPEEQQFVQRFCNELTTHDQWLWGNTCQEILAKINYDAPATLSENGEFYEIKAVLKDRRIVELSRRDGGWGVKWESPAEAQQRLENPLSDDLPFGGWAPNEADIS